MTSLNFKFPNAPAAVNILGAEAELLLNDHPDLALLRIRQLLEVMVLYLERTNDIKVDPKSDLGKRLEEVNRAKLLPQGFHIGILNPLKKSCNDAVHHWNLKRNDSAVFAPSAQHRLLQICRCWATLMGVDPPQSLAAIPFADKLDQAIREQHLLLDGAQATVDERRDLATTDALLERVSTHRLQRLKAKQHVIDLVELRTHSIRLDAANHTGMVYDKTFDRDCIKSLLQCGDPRAKAEVTHLLNRESIRLLNDLQFEEAQSELEPMLDWGKAEADGQPLELIGDGQILDFQRGALLGTLGQLYVFRAHAYKDTDEIETALALFDKARDCFSEEEDRIRQVTYRTQALIERVRLGGSLSDTESAEIDAYCQSVDPTTLDGLNFDVEHYRIATALKASVLLGVDLLWHAKVNEWAASLDPAVPIGHPLVSVAGWMCIEDKNVPKVLRQALQATTIQGRSPLERWIAECFVAATESGHPIPPPPESAMKWWNEYEMANRCEGWVAALPFNYA